MKPAFYFVFDDLCHYRNRIVSKCSTFIKLSSQHDINDNRHRPNNESEAEGRIGHLRNEYKEDRGLSLVLTFGS